MACVNFTGLESADGSEFRSTGGTWSIDSSIKRSGGYSLKINPTGSSVGNARLAANRSDGRPNGEMNVSTLYTTFWWYIVTAPSSSEEKFIEIADTGGSTKAYFTLNSSRNITAYNNAGSSAGTGSTTLALNTWYRIDIKTSTGSGNTAFEVLINGASELSGTMNTLTNKHGSVYIGKRDNLNARDIEFYYDDIWCDDTAFPSSDYSILRIAPDGDSSPAQFTSGTGASDYTQVDEIPPSTSDYIQSGASAATHYVSLQNTGTVGISGTVMAVKAHMMAREVTSGTSSNQLAIKSGASTQTTDAYNHNTSNRHMCLIAEVDPNTTSAWSTSAIDSLIMGIIEGNSIAMRCTYMSAYVAFSEASGQTVEGSFISSGSSLYQAEFTQTTPAQEIDAETIASGSVMYQATIAAGGVSVQASLIGSGSLLYESSVLAGGVSVESEFISSSSALFEGALTVGEATVDAGTIVSGSTLFDASIEAGEVQIQSSLIASTLSVYEGEVSQGAITIEADLIPSGASLFPATISTGSVEVTAEHLPSSAQLFSATVSLGAGVINAERIESSSELFQAELNPGQVAVNAQVISSTTQLFEAEAIPGAVSLSGSFLPGASTLYLGDVSTSALIEGGFLASTSQTFQGSLSVGGVSIEADYITSGSVLYQASVAREDFLTRRLVIVT